LSDAISFAAIGLHSAYSIPFQSVHTSRAKVTFSTRALLWKSCSKYLQ